MSTWKFEKLDSLCTFQNGYAFNSALYSENTNDPIVIRMSNITVDGNFDLSEKKVKHYPSERLNEVQKYILKPNDLLIAMTDMSNEMNIVGHTAIVNGDSTYLLNQRVGKINIIDNRISLGFLYFYTNYETFINYIKSTCTGSIQKNTSTAAIKNALIPVPGKKEQINIVFILTQIKNKISTIDKELRYYRQLKQGLLEKLYTTGIYGEKLQLTDMGEVPITWKRTNIGSVTKKHKNVSITNKSGKYKYIDVSAVSNEFYKVNSSVTNTIENLPGRARRIVENGDVIYATVRPYLKRIALITPEYNGALVSTAFCVMRPEEEKIKSNFLFYYLQRTVVTTTIESFQTGVSYPAVSDKDIFNIPIYLPTIEEQTIISDVLYTLDEKLNLLRDKVNVYSNLFNGILHKLMNQEIDVENLEIDNL